MKREKGREKTTDGREGFTLVEALIAMVFIGVVLPVAIEGVLIASRSGEMAERRREAAVLANRFLDERVAEGDWQTISRDGDFGNDWPDYRWTFEREESSDASGLWRLAATVFWRVQGKEHSLCLTTLAEAPQ